MSRQRTQTPFLRIIGAIMALFLFIVQPAYACMGVSSETQTFLTALPEGADTQDMVAKVQVISTEIPLNGHQRRSVVEVLDSIKGFEEGQKLTVLSDLHSCARDYHVRLDKEYYIAGRINPEGFFEGTWKGLDNRKFWRKTH